MGSTKVFIVASIVACVVAVSSATIVKDEDHDQVSGRKWTDCLGDGDFTCIKYKVLKNVYNLVQKKNVELTKSVRLEFTGDDDTRVATARAVMQQDWTALLSDVFPKLLQSVSFSLQEARGIKDRIILPIAAAGGFYTLLITIGVIAAKFLAFKALLVGKISLVLAAITGLAKIFEQKNQGYTRIESYGAYDRNFIEHPRY